MTTDYLREATVADISVLAKHRLWMFEEMRALEQAPYTDTDLAAMELAYAEFVRAHLGGELRSWVVEAGGRVVASGSMMLYPWPPRPFDQTGRAALLHSIYTEPGHRRRGLARRVTETLLAECRRLGLRTVNLHASHAGRPLYDLLGFRPTSEMRYAIRE